MVDNFSNFGTLGTVENINISHKMGDQVKVFLAEKKGGVKK
jgi:hypothetical protein